MKTKVQKWRKKVFFVHVNLYYTQCLCTVVCMSSCTHWWHCITLLQGHLEINFAFYSDDVCNTFWICFRFQGFLYSLPWETEILTSWLSKCIGHLANLHKCNPVLLCCLPIVTMQRIEESSSASHAIEIPAWNVSPLLLIQAVIGFCDPSLTENIAWHSSTTPEPEVWCFNIFLRVASGVTLMFNAGVNRFVRGVCFMWCPCYDKMFLTPDMTSHKWHLCCLHALLHGHQDVQSFKAKDVLDGPIC